MSEDNRWIEFEEPALTLDETIEKAILEDNSEHLTLLESFYGRERLERVWARIRGTHKEDRGQEAPLPEHNTQQDTNSSVLKTKDTPT